MSAGIGHNDSRGNASAFQQPARRSNESHRVRTCHRPGHPAIDRHARPCCRSDGRRQAPRPGGRHRRHAHRRARRTEGPLGRPRPGRGQVEFDYPKARAGGLDVAFMSIYTSAKQDDDNSAWQTANEMIDSVEALAARHPDKFALLRSPGDVERLRAGGRVLLPMGMENGAPIGDDLSRLQFFFDRGVRYITLAHSANNRIADSSYAAEQQVERPEPVRQAGRRRDEPARDHGRRLASLRRSGAADHHRQPRAGHRQPLGIPPLHARLRTQHQRRTGEGRRRQGRRGADPVRHRLRRPQGSGRHAGAFPRDQPFQPAQCRAQGRGQAGGKQGRIRRGLGRGLSGACDEDRSRARPGRLCGQADWRRPRRHRLGLRRRRRRTAGRPAHDRRLSQPGRRLAGPRPCRRRHPQDPRREPAAGVDARSRRQRRNKRRQNDEAPQCGASWHASWTMLIPCWQPS